MQRRDVNLDQLNINPDLARAATLPSEWYVDPKALPIEQDKIFARTWQVVGPLSKLNNPGDYFTCEVAGEPLVVIKNQQGEINCFSNVCRHRGGPVATGEGNLKVMRCAYHGWLYGLDGALRTTPEFNGVECFDKGANHLRRFRLDTWGPFVFVNLSDEGPSLYEVLGKIPEETKRFPLGRMDFYKRLTYEIDCNWKVYVDNYLEGYHIPMVHPGLMKELDYQQYRVETERYYSKQYAPIRNQGDSLYRRNLEAGAEAQALYYWLFPNLMLNIYPDNIQINVIVPAGPDKTLTIFDWYLVDPDKPELGEDFAKSLAFSDLVQKEDIFICEAVQKGLKSRTYRAGRFSVEREGGVHHFHGLVAEFLKG